MAIKHYVVKDTVTNFVYPEPGPAFTFESEDSPEFADFRKQYSLPRFKVYEVSAIDLEIVRELT